MPVPHRDYPNYLLDVLEDGLTYAHLGECGEWDKHDGDGAIPIEWRCGPSAAPCDNEGATGEPDCLVGHLVKPPINSWQDFDPDEDSKDGHQDIVPPQWCAEDMAGGDGPFSPFVAYYAPGQPASEKWDKVIEESMRCEDYCVLFPGPIECGGVPGTVPSPEPHAPFYFGYDHDFFPGYIRIFPVGPLISMEECTPAAENPQMPGED